MRQDISLRYPTHWLRSNSAFHLSEVNKQSSLQCTVGGGFSHDLRSLCSLSPCIFLHSFQKNNCLLYFFLPNLCYCSPLLSKICCILHNKEKAQMYDQYYLMAKCADMFQMHAVYLYLFRKEENLVCRAYRKGTSNIHSPCISTSSPRIFNYLL